LPKKCVNRSAGILPAANAFSIHDISEYIRTAIFIKTDKTALRTAAGRMPALRLVPEFVF
jgi:hypothetical protein